VIDLAETELAVLKQLHDGVIRPAGKMAVRLGLSGDVIERALHGMHAKGLVEKRPGPKWRITYDGKIALETERLERAQQLGPSGIVAEQEQRLFQYYDQVLDHARQSFRLALTASLVGLLFFLGAAAFVLLNKGTDAAVISVISGALVEFIAGINFYLYGKTTSQLTLFHGRLLATQRFLLANSVCDSVDDELRDRTRSTLILTFAEGAVPESDELRPDAPGGRRKGT
jgi:hypothetical protein